jgi:PEP-CTERM motif
MRYVFAFFAALAAAAPAGAAVVVDDFNRANAPNLGPNYTIQNGGLAILNNAVVGNIVSLSTYNGSSATSAGVDVSLRGFDEGSYVALALGYLGSGPQEKLSYFIKVMDNDGDGWFDKYAFYGGNNNLEGLLGSMNPFQTGSIDVSYTGTIASLLITSGGNTQLFSYDYGFAPSTRDIGLGINRQGRADNLRFDQLASPVPEPATWAMLVAGFGLVGGAMRLRRRTPSIA